MAKSGRNLVQRPNKPFLLAIVLIVTLLVAVIRSQQQTTAALSEQRVQKYDSLTNTGAEISSGEADVTVKFLVNDTWQAAVNQYITESWYNHAPTLDSFSTEKWLSQRRRELADCRMSYSNTTQPVGDVIDTLSNTYGINRRVLLTLLSLQLGSWRGEESCDSLSGAVKELDRIGNEMTEVQLLFRSRGGASKPSGTDTSLIQPWDKFPNDVTFAVAHAVTIIANDHKQDPHELYQEFFQFFHHFFGDPEGAPSYILSDKIIDSVTYLMPFYQERPYTSGPHAAGSLDTCVPVNLSDVSGIDFGSPDVINPLNKAVVAIAPGEIVGIKHDTTQGKGGNWVAVRHENNVVSMYWHLSVINSQLQLNQLVNAGAYLGDIGDTGCSELAKPCGVHIHLELRQGGGNYSTWEGKGIPVPWTDKVIDGWRIYPQVYPTNNPPTGRDGKGVNYNGTALRNSAVNGNFQKKISTSCGEVYAAVEDGFPYDNEDTNTTNTKFAWYDRRTRLPSSNNVHCPSSNPAIESDLDSPNSLCGGGSDTTPPSAAGFSVSVAGRTATITTSGVKDNSGGSGVKEVRFSAKWGGNWYVIGIDNSEPYSLSWDMCANNVPNGDVELGMEVRDNAGNSLIWSSQSPNPRFTKDFNCGDSGDNKWRAKYYDTIDKWNDDNNNGNFRCEGVVSGKFLYKDFGNGAECGMDGDGWTADFTQTINFPSGNYVFYVSHDDGLRLWVGNSRIHEKSEEKHNYHVCPPQALSGNVDLRVMLREDGGEADVYVSWSTDTSPCVDRTAPTVTWLEPVTNEGYYNASGQTVRLKVNASDSSGVSRVEFDWWNGTGRSYIGEDSTAPYEVDFDTSVLHPGCNIVDAVAYDRLGNNGRTPIWICLSILEAPTLIPISNPDALATFVVSWPPVPGADGYILQQQYNSGNWFDIQDSSATYSNVTVNDNLYYCYRVRARNSAGFSPWSNEECTIVSTLFGSPTLSPITNWDYDQTFVLEWSSIIGAVAYQIDEQDTWGNWKRIAQINGTTFTINDAEPGFLCYRVRGARNSSVSPWSNDACVFVLFPPPTIHSLNLYNDYSAFSVNWTLVDGATGYVLDERFNDGEWVEVFNGPHQSISATGRDAGQWCYRVKAYYEDASSYIGGRYSSEACITLTENVGPPPTPTIYSIVNPNQSRSFWVYWNGSPQATEFQLQESHNGGFWAFEYEGGSTGVQMQGRAAGVWCYRIRAKNGAGFSNWSVSACTQVQGERLDVKLFLPSVLKQ